MPFAHLIRVGLQPASKLGDMATAGDILGDALLSQAGRSLSCRSTAVEVALKMAFRKSAADRRLEDGEMSKLQVLPFSLLNAPFTGQLSVTVIVFHGAGPVKTPGVTCQL